MLLVTFLGCAGGETEPNRRATVQIDTIAGVIHVRNSGAPPEWSLGPPLSIASAGDEEFGRITAVSGDDSGNVYVADAIARHIYVFDAQGTFVNTIGREGAGPGEVRALKSIAWIGGKLAAEDASNARIALFERDGSWGGSFPWQPLTGSDVRLWQTEAREAYVRIALPRTDGERGLDSYFVRLRDSGPADTIRRFAGEEPPAGIMCQATGGIHFFSIPHTPQPYATPAPDVRQLVGITGEPRLIFLRDGGDTARVVEWDAPAVPVSDEEWSVEEAEYAKFQSYTRDGRCEGASFTRPESKVAFRSVIFDDAGRPWVESETADGYAYRVFARDGGLQAIVQAPAERDRDVPPAIRGERFHYVTADSLGVQTVHVAHIQKTAP